MTVEADTIAALRRARAAAPRMALATTVEKNDFLRRLAGAIRRRGRQPSQRDPACAD